MATGGTVVRSRTAAPSTLPAPRRWLDAPRVVEHLPFALAVVVFAGCFMRIRQRWFIPGMTGFGYTTRVVQTTVDGTAIAPNQYRPMMPWVDHWLSLLTGLALPTAILVSDLLLLVVLLVLLHHLGSRLEAAWLPLAAAAGWAWWVAKLDQWHPEIMLLSVVVTATTLLLLDRRPRWALLLALGVVACAARTDYAAGLGVVVMATGLHRRQIATAAAGLAVIGAAAVATEQLVRAYPQAHYATDVVQLPYNLTPGTLALDVAFYGLLLLVPALCALVGRRLPPLAFVVAWFLVEFAFVFLVGRTDESRIFMPLAPVLAAAAALAWRELRAMTLR